ncbi:MAG TPA: phosphotransferase [Candidatus Methylacidiphilales bacterium]|nr:phosphotransferase [Candidatus Methylacidiphilales bacterium]
MVPFSIPSSVAELYGVRPEAFSFLAHVQNYVFGFRRNDGEFILRFTPEHHRSADQVNAELHWLQHLASEHAPVSRVVPSQEGSLSHRITLELEEHTSKKPCSTHFTAAAFSNAQGEIGQKRLWTTSTFNSWGNAAARLHCGAISYQPAQSAGRDHWTRDLPPTFYETADTLRAYELYLETAATLACLPRSNDNYNLIHADLHFWNFAVSESGNLTVFDFDNCEYNWLIADLATALFEATTCAFQQLPRQEFIRKFVLDFLAGYDREYDKGFGIMLNSLPDFVKFREIQIFLILSRRWKNHDLGPFQLRFFAELKESVLSKKAFVEARTMDQILAGKRE